jgi:biotin transporter BioY
VKVFDQKQIKELANFLTTTSVAWFSAGVIAPFFTNTTNSEVFILSVTFGFIMAFIFIALSVTIIRDKND